MIVLINPNSTDAMTRAMVATAARAGIEVTGWTSHEGPAAIQGPEDGAACVPPLLELVRKASRQGASVIIIGCFDDTGLHAARDIATCPVIGIGQAAYHIAALSGHRFSVVTTLAVSVPVLEANINAYGFGLQLARVRASGVSVLALESAPQDSIPTVIQEIKRAISDDQINSVVLGCAGMVDIPELFVPEGVTLIDGVLSAVRLAPVIMRAR